MLKFVALICLFATLLNCVKSSEEILGCGGFVKSDVPIDFSNIEVRKQAYTFIINCQDID